jgi:hypothetical protein
MADVRQRRSRLRRYRRRAGSNPRSYGGRAEQDLAPPRHGVELRGTELRDLRSHLAPDHVYERFAPQNPDAQPTRTASASSSSAPAGLDGFNAPLANSVVRHSAGYGVLKLTLHASSYDWAFVPVSGSTFGDAGSGSCH